MSDGRTKPGPLHALVRTHYALERDIDLAGQINGMTSAERSSIAQLARIVAESEARGGGVRSLIQGLVASRLFLEQ